MCDRLSAASVWIEVEEQLTREYLKVFKELREKVPSDEAAARMTNAIMVGTDYVMQYKATQFSDTLPEFQTADKVASPAPAPTPAAAAPPEAPKAEVPRPPATGPAVASRPFGTPTPADKLTVVHCKKCGTDCERKISERSQKPYYRCPKCCKNRQKSGEAFPGDA